MSEWKTYRLGDLCSRIKSGKGIPASEVSTTGEYPVIGGNGIRGYTNTSNFNGVCAVVGRQGAYCGNVRFFSGEAYMTEHAVVIVGNELADTRYLAYLLSIMQLGHLSAQSAQPGLSVQTLSKLSINIPDISTQRRIAGILGSLDDKIELNRRLNANLEAQAQALFRSWFVDFEPFRDGPFVDSELGKIPQGWKVGTINEIIQILSGYAFKSDTFTEAGPYRLITIKNVQDGSLNIDGAAYLSEIPDKMPQHCHLAIGDILLSLTGNVGRVCIVDRDGLLLNQRVAKLQPKDKRNTFFTYALFRQDSFKQYLIQIAKGTAQLNLSPVETSDTKIVLPNQDILLQFGEIGQPLFDNIVSNCKEIITLSALRDTLLPKLIAGEIAIE